MSKSRKGLKLFRKCRARKNFKTEKKRSDRLYTVLYNNYLSQRLMEVLATPVPSRSQHSLSYNELKRRRLQRSVSHKKMTIPQQPTHSKRRHLTEQKSLVSSIPKDEKVIEGVIHELNHVLGDIRRKKSQKGFFSLRQSMTDRPSKPEKAEKAQNTERKVQPLWSSVEENGQTKQFIRLLLNKNKSQRRLIKFNEVRDRFKMQKERSRSQSKSKIVKEVVSPYKEKTAEKQGLIQEVISQDSHRQTVKIQAKSKLSQVPSLDAQLDMLSSCPQDLKEQLWLEELKGKQNQERVNFSIDTNEVSVIKRSEEIDDSYQHYKTIFEKTHVEGSFLKLLDNGNELENRLPSRETKRRSQIDRVRKIFPVGFFAN